MISENGINHCTAIKSLSRLLGSSNTKHKCKQYFCTNCLQGFSLEASLDEHRVYCKDNEAVKVEMPRIETLKFCDGQNQFKVPFVMYYDLEALLPHTEERAPNDLRNPYTIRVSKHVPCGWTVRSKFAYGEVADPEVNYRGKDCIKTLCEHLTKEASHLYHMFPEKPMDPLSVKSRLNI